MCWDPSHDYLVVLSQFVKHQHCIKGSFGLYFGVVKSHIYSLAAAIYENIFVFDFSE